MIDFIPHVHTKEENFSLIGASCKPSKTDWSGGYTGDGQPFSWVDFMWVLVHLIPLAVCFFVGVLAFNMLTK